jgi:tricorn protease-like protein
VSASDDKTIRVWDAVTGLEIQTLKGHTDGVNSVAITSDGKRIVSASDDKTIRVWDAVTGMEIHTLKGHTDGVNSVAITSDSKRIVSGSYNKTIKVWDIATGQEIPASHLTKDGYSLTSKGQISQDKQWSVDFNESDVVLINNKMRNERIAGDQEKLARWAKPDPQWHLFQATESEKANQWFAVAFHLRKLLEIEPANEDAKKRLQIAENNLKKDK